MLSEAIARAMRDEMPGQGCRAGWVGEQSAEDEPRSLTMWGDHA